MKQWSYWQIFKLLLVQKHNLWTNHVFRINQLKTDKENGEGEEDESLKVGFEKYFPLKK